LEIDGGNDTTTDKGVTLSITAIELNFLTLMRFSLDGVNWEPWVDYEPTKTYQLPDVGGEYTIYVQIMDVAGNISNPFSDSIRFEKEIPYFIPGFSLIWLGLFALTGMVLIYLKSRKRI
jgi:hypothetical protein